MYHEPVAKLIFDMTVLIFCERHLLSIRWGAMTDFRSVVVTHGHKRVFRESLAMMLRSQGRVV